MGVYGREDLVLPLLSTHGINSKKKQIKAIHGIGDEIVQQLRKIDMVIEEINPVIDPEATKYILEVMVKEAGVKMYYHCWASNVIVENDEIKAVIFETKTGRLAIKPKVVIDCTGDGDVFHWAGESYDMMNYELGLVHRLGNTDRIDKNKPGYKKMKLGGATPLAGVNWVNMSGGKYENAIDFKRLSELQQQHRIDIWNQVQEIRSTPGHEEVFLLDTACQQGVRMSRILKGAYQLTLEDSMTYKSFDDVIGVSGGWISVLFQGKGTEWYDRPMWQIPYRSLLPLKTKNLLVAGRCFCFEKDLFQDTRIIGTCLVTGQGAGVAAAIASNRGQINKGDRYKHTASGTKRTKCLSRMKLGPGNIRNTFFIVAAVTAFPLPVTILTGILLWPSPFMFLNSVFALKSVVLLNLLGLLGLILVGFKNKWICRYACPLGVVCDLASKARPQQYGYRNIRSLNKYLAVFSLTIALTGLPILIIFDPFNLFHLSFEFVRTGLHTAALVKLSFLLAIVAINILLPNIWCSRLCPLGGLQQLIIDIKRYFRKPIDGIFGVFSSNRRMFLAGFSGVVSGFLIPGVLKGSNAALIRPPASLNDPDFNLVCARCGDCSSACPTKIIQQSIDIGNPEMLLTPVVNMSESYCLPECTSCGDVCPSGAISKFMYRR